MTLGIGYKGKDFAVLLTDSMGFAGPEMIPNPGSGKFHTSGERMAYMVSGRSPMTGEPDVSEFDVTVAARKMRDWMRTVPQDRDDVGRSLYVLLAGAPKGHPVELVLLEGIGGPRIAAIGDVLVAGYPAVRARELGMERNYGELTPRGAEFVLLELAGEILHDLYASYGCRDEAELAVKMPGSVLTVAPPFRTAIVNADSVTIQGDYFVGVRS